MISVYDSGGARDGGVRDGDVGSGTVWVVVVGHDSDSGRL